MEKKTRKKLKPRLQEENIDLVDMRVYMDLD